MAINLILIVLLNNATKPLSVIIQINNVKNSIMAVLQQEMDAF